MPRLRAYRSAPASNGSTRPCRSPGWTADEWASSSPLEKAETTIPQGVPCTRLANLISHRSKRGSASRPTYRAGAFNWPLICLRARLGQSIVTEWSGSVR